MAGEQAKLLCSFGGDFISRRSLSWRRSIGRDLDLQLVSVETKDDVRQMMAEFNSTRKISIFLFTDKIQNTDDDELAVEDCAHTRNNWNRDRRLKSSLRPKAVEALWQHHSEEIMGGTHQLVLACLERYFRSGIRGCAEFSQCPNKCCHFC